MRIIKKNVKTRKYRCPSCESIIEIRDDEFELTKEYPLFHMDTLEDYQKDNRIDIRICHCPVCHGYIRKEYDLFIREELK